MSSIWDICEKTETVKTGEDNSIYYKAKLNIALKEIKVENSQKKLDLFIKIEKIKKSNFIKIYDYFDENESIYILFENEETKIKKLNEILYEEENIVKEISIKKHGGPIHKTEINKLFIKGMQTMCKILVKKGNYSGNGTGFFCKIRHPNINLGTVLLTNNHVLDSDFLKEGNIIEYEYNNNIIKNLNLTKERRFYTNKELDYTCIEIFESDNIDNFFEIDENIINEDYESLKNSEIFILQYPKGDEISFSQGQILNINEKIIIHSASTEEGSSGSPIILRNNQYNYKIMGVHFGGNKDRNQNYACPFSQIIYDLKAKVNNLAFSDNFQTISSKEYFNNLIVLQDGRLSTCNNEGEIKVFNKNNKDIDLNMRLYDKKAIEYHFQLKNSYIVACCFPIKIIKLKKKLMVFESYEIIQSIYNDNQIGCQKIIEMDNNRFIASFANSMILCYSNKNTKNNLYVEKSMSYIGNMSTHYSFTGKANLLKINDNEFVGSSKNNKCIQFFMGGEDDIVENKKIENINSNGHPNSMVIKDDILLVGGQQCEGIYLISLKNYELIGKTKTDIIFDVFSIINLSNGNILAGTEEDKRNFSLVEYKVENNDLIEVKRKNYAHSLNIFNLIEINGIIISNSNDNTIKFWK